MGTILHFEPTDLSEELLRRSHSGTSFMPELRAEQRRQEYLNYMAAVDQEFAQWVTDENRDAMAADLELYRLGWVQRFHAYLGAHSRCVSVMIAGASGFPVAKQQKRSDTADRRMLDVLEYQNGVLSKLRRKYDPVEIARRPIRAGDADAVERLQDKLEQLEATQAYMKEANRRIRAAKGDEQAALTSLVEMGVRPDDARILVTPSRWGEQGFQDFTLKNNNANMRQVRDRIEAIKAEQARRAEQPTEDRQVTILSTPATVIENTVEDRLQVVFDGKPPAEVRDRMKSNGFRWAPSQNAWQRQLTTNARAALEYVIDK